MNTAPTGGLQSSTDKDRALESKMLARGKFPYSKQNRLCIRKKLLDSNASKGQKRV